MPLFRRRSEPRLPPPAWALGLTSETYGPFIEVVRAELKRHGLNDARIDEGEGYVQRGEVQLGLHNLAQQYGQAAKRDRGTIVRVHFDQILTASEERDAVAHSWEQARAALKVRLYPAGSGGAIARPLAEGIAEVLVLDLPTTVASVNAEDAASWGHDTAELFMSAYQNLAGEPQPSLETVDLEGGASLLAYTGDSFFTTSQLLFIEHLVADIPPAGLVVAVPNRHVLLVYPIDDLRVVQAIQRLIPMARGLYERGPGSLAADLYWWRGGELVLLPARIDGEQITFVPPDAFVELLNGLAPRPDS